MFDCTYIRKDMLSNPIEIRTEGEALSFDSAKAMADEKARERSTDPMLLSWFDRKAGKFFPRDTCCGSDKPTWLVYAEARGGDISVDFNDEEYVFVYTEGPFTN
jgi:Domain of unknown function (DUF5619)